MKSRTYTVKQLAALAGVGIKTLHHYDAIGLLPPLEHSVAGYRLYGHVELQRLQHILFYRELGFPLKTIGELLSQETDRLSILRDQRALILQRHERFGRLLATLDRTIASAEQGKVMPDQTLFEGFSSDDEWNNALAAHNLEMKAKYGADIPPIKDASEQNQLAREAIGFMAAIAAALRAGTKPSAPSIMNLIGDHLEYLERNGHPSDAARFVRQTQFFLEDDFHHGMLERQQGGLSAYLAAAARAFADRGHPSDLSKETTDHAPHSGN
jgi:DNA-binding transcriptional MerR regulator